jgi:hypothetical protein
VNDYVAVIGRMVESVDASTAIRTSTSFFNKVFFNKVPPQDGLRPFRLPAASSPNLAMTGTVPGIAKSSALAPLPYMATRQSNPAKQDFIDH